MRGEGERSCVHVRIIYCISRERGEGEKERECIGEFSNALAGRGRRGEGEGRGRRGEGEGERVHRSILYCISREREEREAFSIALAGGGSRGYMYRAGVYVQG